MIEVLIFTWAVVTIALIFLVIATWWYMDDEIEWDQGMNCNSMLLCFLWPIVLPIALYQLHRDENE